MRHLAAGAAVLAMTCFVGGCLFTPADPAPNIDTDAAIAHYVKSQGLSDAAALAELMKALEADPKLSNASAAAGDIYRRQGNLDQARKFYESSCDSNPYYFKPHFNLGVVYQAMADKAATDELLETYLRRACDVYLRAIAIKAVVVKANDHDSDFYDANLNLSACYFQLGKYHEAEEYCQAAIAVNDDNPLGWTNLGTIYDNQGKLAEAISAYRQSLERDVHQPRLHLNLGSAYVRQGWLKDAVGAFRAASREDPKSVQPYLQLGVVYYRMKDIDNAIEAYLAASRIDPKCGEAYRGLGVVYMGKFLDDQTKTDLREKALAAWKRSLELNPKQDDLVTLVNKYTPKYEEKKL